MIAQDINSIYDQASVFFNSSQPEPPTVFYKPGWRVKQYDWKNKVFTKPDTKPYPFPSGPAYNANMHAIFIRELDSESIFPEITHAIRACEIGYAHKDGKDMVDFSPEHIIDTQMRKVFKYVDKFNKKYPIAQRYFHFLGLDNLEFNFSEFYEALSKEVDRPGSVTDMVESSRKWMDTFLKEHKKNYGKSPHTVQTYATASSIYNHMMYFAVENIEDVGKFMNKNPVVIRDCFESVALNNPEIFENLIDVESVIEFNNQASEWANWKLFI